MLYDSHAHLDNNMDLSGVSLVNDIGTDLETSKTAVLHAERYDFCYAVVGFHPEGLPVISDEALKEIAKLCKHPKVKAIGEIGLDYHYEDGASREDQLYWFGRQIDLANELAMPIVIHSREADEDTMETLKAHGAFSKDRCSLFPVKPDGSPDARVLLHCFSSSAEMGVQYVKLGATLSFAGPLTYKNARKTVETAERVDLMNLLVETDSPYLTPVPFRGQCENRPGLVEYTARKLAEIKGLSFEEVAEATYNNAKRFFNI